MTAASGLDEFVQDEATGLLVPPRTRRQVIPYDDLNATDRPDTYPTISPDLLSTLAVMVAQGPTGPKVVNATSYGSPHVASQVAVSTKAADGSALNATTVRVEDASWAATNPWFHIIGLTAPDLSIHGPYFGFQQSDLHVVKVNTPLAQAVHVGDVLYWVPYVMVAGVGSAIDIVDRVARLLGHVNVDNFPATTDVSDRAARLLGHVTVDSLPAPLSFPFSKRIDITATGSDQAVGLGQGANTVVLGPSTLFSGTAIRVSFKDGNAGTTKWVQPVLANTPTPINWFGLLLTAGNDLFVNGPNTSEIELSVSYGLK